jgi:hypothetical protein
MIDTEKLRKLAEGVSIARLPFHSIMLSSSLKAFNEAANPATILSLLDELEARK